MSTRLFPERLWVVGFYPLLLLVISTTCLGGQESGPSLAETLKYLQEKLYDVSVIYDDLEPEDQHSHRHDLDYSCEVDVPNKVLVVTEDEREHESGIEGEKGRTRRRKVKVVIPLAELDPKRVSVSSERRLVISSDTDRVFFIEIRAPIGRKVITYEYQTGARRSGSWSDYDFVVRDEDDSKRISRALERAIELSGGKPELFGDE